MVHEWKSSTFKGFAVASALFGVACDSQKVGDDGSIANSTPSAEQPLPRLHKIPSFSLTDQTGSPFGSTQLIGTPYLVAFVFTRCPSICPRVMERMKEVRRVVQSGNQRLNLVNISVDPEHDSPPVLRAFAHKHGADVPHWWLLTGDYKEIAETSEVGFKIGLSGRADQAKPEFGITHGSHFVLVDKTGTARGYFRSTDESTPLAILRALERL